MEIIPRRNVVSFNAVEASLAADTLQVMSCQTYCHNDSRSVCIAGIGPHSKEVCMRAQLALCLGVNDNLEVGTSPTPADIRRSTIEVALTPYAPLLAELALELAKLAFETSTAIGTHPVDRTDEQLAIIMSGIGATYRQDYERLTNLDL